MTQRTEQVSELLRSEISAILSEELELPDGALVTIIDVDCPPDLKNADVWVSIYPKDNAKATFDLLKERRGDIQHQINSRLEMKIVPRIEWRLDGSEEHADHINRLLDDLHDDA